MLIKPIIVVSPRILRLAERLHGDPDAECLGLSFWPFIVLPVEAKRADKRTLKHELQHHRDFGLWFAITWVWDMLRVGYRGNRWEVRARKAERRRLTAEDCALLGL